MATTTAIYNLDATIEYDLITLSPLHFPSIKPANNDSSSSLRKAILQQLLHMGSSHHLPLPSSPLFKHSLLHQLQGHSYKKTRSTTNLAGKLQDIISNPLMIAPLKTETTAVSCQPYVYTAPCEHHPSKGQTDYLVNDMLPKLRVSAGSSV